MFRLLKRNRQSGRLQSGDLSTVSQAACDDVYVQKCFEDAEDQRSKFATILCLLFYRCAEMLVDKIEQESELLTFYEGTSRDVMIFESFLFYQYVVSEFASEYVKPGWQDSFDHYTSLAAHAGAVLAKKRLGEFNAKAYRKRRLKLLSKYCGDAMQMTETFCGVLLCLAGKRHVDDPDGKLSLDLTINLKVRQVAHAASGILVRAACENVGRIYDKHFDPVEYEMKD